ncbi:MAG: (Fe-S)-binding protein [Bacteroidia bacterium]
MQVELFITCLIDQFYPSVGWNMVKLLEKLNCSVSYNPNQTCCGMPAFFNGHKESGKEVATKFLEDFNSKAYVVTPSAMCSNMVVNSYDTFFKNTSNHNIYRALQQRIFELSDFLINKLGVQELPSVFNQKVAFHHNCAGVNSLQKTNESIALLQMVKGCELVHTSVPNTCCGFGGDFATYNEKEAVAQAENLLEMYKNAGAQVVVSNDQNCLFHFLSLKKNEHDLKFMHLADVLAQGI